MTFEQLWTILIKQWKIIVTCLMVVGTGTYIITKLTHPLYQSTVLVQVATHSTQNSVFDINSLLASNQLIQTEADLATSSTVLREVASHYHGLSVDQLTSKVSATPKMNTQLFEINVLDPNPDRAAALANDIAQTLIKHQMEFIRQYPAQSGNFLFLAQTAVPASKPSQPNTLLNTGEGLLIGLLLGILLAVLFDRLDMRIRSVEDLHKWLGISVLSTIWQTEAENVINQEESKVNVEAYRILRTNIGLSARDKPLQSIVVTSAVPREGKSMVAANLAIHMAKAGKNTLLVDVDLRHPTQHIQFGLPPTTSGLCNAVMAYTANQASSQNQFLTAMPSPPLQGSSSSDDFSLNPFIHTVSIPCLHLMPSGVLPTNPSDLFDSKAMQNLLGKITNCGAEVVIFDAPPLLGLSDTSSLATHVDGVLVVVNITHANKKKLKQMQAILAKTGAFVLGCVVNRQKCGIKEEIPVYYSDNQNGQENTHYKERNSYLLPVLLPSTSESNH
jgi:Mrp family chromosome partitioning ATPase/capsular polysaccharide biosynthesis protein